MIEQLNKTQILQRCFNLIDEHKVVLLEYGRAVVYGNNIQPYNVNFTLETCECFDHTVDNIKCEHIYAAQFKQRQVLEKVN